MQVSFLCLVKCASLAVECLIRVGFPLWRKSRSFFSFCSDLMCVHSLSGNRFIVSQQERNDVSKKGPGWFLIQAEIYSPRCGFLSSLIQSKSPLSLYLKNICRNWRLNLILTRQKWGICFSSEWKIFSKIFERRPRRSEDLKLGGGDLTSWEHQRDGPRLWHASAEDKQTHRRRQKWGLISIFISLFSVKWQVVFYGTMSKCSDPFG